MPVSGSGEMFGTRNMPKSFELQPAGELQLLLALRLRARVAGGAAAGVEDALAVGEIRLVRGKLSRSQAAQARSGTSRQGGRRRSPRTAIATAARRSINDCLRDDNSSWQALQFCPTSPEGRLERLEVLRLGGQRRVRVLLEFGQRRLEAGHVLPDLRAGLGVAACPEPSGK